MRNSMIIRHLSWPGHELLQSNFSEWKILRSACFKLYASISILSKLILENILVSEV